MSRFSISCFFILLTFVLQAQERTPTEQVNDSTDSREAYGIRIGVDLSRPALSFFIEDYTGFEIVGDYRLTENLYLAAELGTEERTQDENVANSVLYEYETSGSYLKAGVDINTYQNWFGMRNQISFGGRYAFSSFSQTLNNFRFFDSNRLFSPDDFVLGSDTPIEFSSLNASWLEFVLGIKAEVMHNIYIGMSARLGFLITNKEPDNFRNLWIPGFNRVTAGSNFGVGFNYSISYFLPLYKKKKQPKEKAQNQ